MPYFMPTERRNYLMILKSAKAHGEKNDEPPTVVNLKSGW
ncbi:transposase family protein [Escherichia coli 1-392-07_S3_C1]|uniref:Transposase family protein n=1 Tax=Escherichia coli 1-250-04_S3_C1 TaxID=1444135 RepID=A0AAN4NTS8_ECOLX|nr:putative IS protein [Escherichia coli DEC6E]EZJ72617.1 transposase family protein [Escherichia coli 1-392-07_S3_C3]EZJ85558.1 transposase family protein [Escherichia coli 1-250-04_S3_C1]KDW56230.1 transposase family protein [Escherichia coli 1-392-07_S3_C2]KDX01741.1 transposase family protein [Escherichia coli 1-392-07_S3_C1]KDZ80801.1 transposase family protein [Escherichia coli 3-105-05_S1_C2]